MNLQNLTFSELINKISTSRFYNLPKMVAEAFRKIPEPTAGAELPYKVYTALLTQSGTDAPVATVLENTLGEDVVWVYDTVGSYYIENTGLFITNKTVVDINNRQLNLADFITVTDFYLSGNEDQIFLDVKKFDGITSTFTAENDLIINSKVEIKVYN